MLTPGSIWINYDKATETYAFDSSKGPDAHDKFGVERKNVLMWMGTMLEKFLTLRPKVFNTLVKQASGNTDVGARAQVPKEEAYQYSTVSNRGRLSTCTQRLNRIQVSEFRNALPIRLRGQETAWDRSL